MEDFIKEKDTLIKAHSNLAESGKTSRGTHTCSHGCLQINERLGGWGLRNEHSQSHKKEKKRKEKLYG